MKSYVYDKHDNCYSYSRVPDEDEPDGYTVPDWDVVDEVR